MYYIYIITNEINSTFYIGVTNNLVKRVYEHGNKLTKGFTYKYNLWKLVYYEEYKKITEAIKREKQLKNWKRGWKIDLIRKHNAEFDDLGKKII